MKVKSGNKMLSGILGMFVLLFKHYSKDKKICKERKNDAQIFFLWHIQTIYSTVTLEKHISSIFKGIIGHSEPQQTT